MISHHRTGPWAPVFLYLLMCIALLTTPARATDAPALPLAETYRKGIDLDRYWVSEKLDGVRAYWDGERFWSRGGHEYRAPGWFTEGFPEVPLDGELWLGRQRFAELSGIVRKLEPLDSEWRQVQFHAFDLPMADTPFRQRYERLQSLISEAKSPYLALVTQRPVPGHEWLMAELERVVAAGAEGLMLKRINSRYRAGRSDDLLKVKTHEDAEAVVVRHHPGQGRLEGLMGALEVRMPDGRQFRIGTGFTDADRASPPPPGSTITFRYRGLTNTGLPRFASFLRVRDDEPPAR